MRRVSMLIATVLLSAGCFHATIETGLPAGTETISKPWASGWIFGLIAPSTVETASKCKNGVARVETQHSFLNMLAMMITFDIYSPIQIDVTCASSSKMSALNGSAEGTVIRVAGNTPEARATALNEAALAAIRSGLPSLVVF